MRTPLAALFDEALNSCFSSTVEAVLGRPARNAIYDVLAKRGIIEADVSARFDDIVDVLMKVFGDSFRVIVHKMVVDLYRDYSQRVDFSYGDSLRDRLLFLKDRVVADHLAPSHSKEVESFFDKGRSRVEDSGAEAGKDTGWSSFYRLKKGVGHDRDTG